MIIKTVIHCSQILSCFSREHPILGITEIATKINMKKSNVHHLITSLVEIGFLEKTYGNKYKLGPKLFELGNLSLTNMEIDEVARPALQHLTNKTDETTHLGLLSGLDVLFVQIIESKHRMRVTSQVGYHLPLYSCAMGKVLLAHHMHLFPIVSREMGKQLTTNTIVSPESLYNELLEVQKLGYALNLEESTEGLTGVASAVFDHTGKAIAAISVAGPTSRIQKLGTPFLVEEVQKAAMEISKARGYKMD